MTGPRPRLLDLFCGAGGCSVGYERAGFDVMGVDVAAHPDYPFPMIVADAMDVLGDDAFLSGFDVIHASPPCPFYSVATHATGTRDQHPDLVLDVLAALRAWGGTWVVENVPGAPLPDAVLMCGASMGCGTAEYRLKRHRLFQSSELLMSPGCSCDSRPAVSVYGHAQEYRTRTGERVHIGTDAARHLMGVTWMRDREDMADAIPPNYTEYLGSQLIAHLKKRNAA